MGCWLSGPWKGEMRNGRNFANLSQRDALQILAATQCPITMQVKSQRSQGDGTSWEPLPLNLQHLSLPLPMMGAGHTTPTYQERHYYNHLPLPHNHCDGRYGYLPSSPRDTMDIGSQDPELTSQRPKEQNCLMGCCNPNFEDPNGCQSKEMDDEDFMLEKPLGFLPLHHELDSGLGWTDGSLHQGDLSGLETEEGGIEDCKSHGALLPGSCRGFGGGGSPSSESYISSELSDSGFYSVSTGEFRHFQRLLEKRMRLYNARIQHQGEPCERRERRDSCPKSHRELLEAIPEALTTQSPYQSRQVTMEESVIEPPTHGLFRVSSVQFHKADRPCLNRHSSSSGALFNPCHAAVSRMTAPVLSTCSTPSSHRKPLIPMQEHQGYNSVGMLRRSRTLHHRPLPQEYRRRASHPALPSPCRVHQLARGLPEEGELMVGAMASNKAGLAQSVHQHPIALGHITHERCHDNNPSNQEAHHDWWHLQERCLMTEPMVAERDKEFERNLEEQRKVLKNEELEREAEIQEEINRGEQKELHRSGAREQQQFQNLVQSFQMGDINDTWPKPANRQPQGGVTGRGLYSTLEGHTGACSTAGSNAIRGHTDAFSRSNPSSGLTDPGGKPISTSRFSRNQLLRDRASQLANERSGMSTDEETNNDMLMGRYWTRTERKEQFLLAREQKQQQLQAKATPARDTIGRGGAPADREANFIENIGLADNRAHGALAGGRCNMALKLSQRKLSRLRNRKLLDDWITVEELLTHGTRLDNQEHMLCPSSLLTVTTV